MGATLRTIERFHFRTILDTSVMLETGSYLGNIADNPTNICDIFQKTNASNNDKLKQAHCNAFVKQFTHEQSYVTTLRHLHRQLDHLRRIISTSPPDLRRPKRDQGAIFGILNNVGKLTHYATGLTDHDTQQETDQNLIYLRNRIRKIASIQNSHTVFMKAAVSGLIEAQNKTIQKLAETQKHLADTLDGEFDLLRLET